jgi:xanthine/CO dehydrogenase XdhC/CoxF family maturation factor
MAHEHDEDPACAVAHGESVPGADADAVAHGHAAGGTVDRTLVAVFASPVADFLLRFGADLGFRTLLLEPDAERAARLGGTGAEVVAEPPADLDGTADVVVTDHHRPELGVMLRDVLKRRVRWVGVMGRALADLGVPADEIARVHRPIGLNIGSRTPPEIAVATLAGLLADRTGSPGGFAF